MFAEETTVAEVREVIEGVLAGRWSMANGKAWFERHTADQVQPGESEAHGLARQALEAIKAGYGGAPRVLIEERLAALLG